MGEPTIGQRANAWRRSRHLSTDPVWIMAKATEELGEVARALVGIKESRDGRGDLRQEVAQTMIVLASLVDVMFEADALDDVLAELSRLGA